MNHPCIIYALINPIDKNVFYVGKTTDNIKTRYLGHLSKAKTGVSDKDKIILQQEILEIEALFCLILQLRKRKLL